MINFEIFLAGLMITSTLTGLTTEAIKKVLVEHNVNHRANTLAGVVALVLSVLIGVGYIIVADIDFSGRIAVCMAAQAFMSWLCAMLGRDKVVQAINQFKTTGKE